MREIVTDPGFLWQISLLFASTKIKFGPEVQGKTGKGHEAGNTELGQLGYLPSHFLRLPADLLAKGLKLTIFTVDRVN